MRAVNRWRRSSAIGACRNSTSVAGFTKAGQPYLPQVLKVDAATDLHSSGDFSLACICEHIAYDRVFVDAKHSDNRFFMYNDQSGAQHLLKDEAENKDNFINLTTGELQDALEGSGGEGFVYFTAPLSEVAPTFARSCTGWRELSLREPTKSLDAPERELNIWIGSEGCATQAHYDTDDNVFVQLHGSKRFKFFSPATSAQLHLFPDAHPRARKSQVDFDASPASNLARFPNYAEGLLPGEWAPSAASVYSAVDPYNV
jgi:hypothetical protein